MRVAAFEIDAGIPDENLMFYSVERIDSDPLPATLSVTREGAASLVLETSRLAAPGVWRAAVCDAGGAQLGLIEIVL